MVKSKLKTERSSSRSPTYPPRPSEFRKPKGGSKRYGQVLFSTDFDGTLVSIASRPDEVRLDPKVLHAIQKITAEMPLLICTGRAHSDLIQFLPECEMLDVIGNHGLEWNLHSGEKRDLTPPEWYSFRAQFLNEISDLVRAQGGFLEDKHRSLTLHFRNSGGEYWLGKGHAWLKKRLPSFMQALPGKECWNIIPVNASKGAALALYMREHGYQTVVYFGDEPTDETIFELDRQGLGFEVVGVKVGDGSTRARYRLASPSDVGLWFEELSGQLSILDSGLI